MSEGKFVVTPELQLEVVTFYARQMRLLDALKIEDYVATFTDDGVTDHAHRNHRVAGKEEQIAAAYAALPRYVGVSVRHWNADFLIESADGETLKVTYNSLVTRTDKAGKVDFEPTFHIEDVLVRVDGELRTKQRTVFRDEPYEPAA